jgi:phage-related protein
MVYDIDIDIHELNLRPFRNLKFLDEISFKKCVFFAFVNNKCIIIYFFTKKTITISKRRSFYRWVLH